MPNATGAPLSQDETIQELSAWIAKALTKVEEKLQKKKKKARQNEAEEDFPPLMLRWSDPGGDEKDVHAFDAEELEACGGSQGMAQKVYAIASRDGASLGDKQSYFVSLEGFPGRFPLVFDDGLDDEDGFGEGDEHGEDPDGPEGGEPRGTGAVMSRWDDRRGMTPNGGPQGRVPIYDYVEWAKIRSHNEQHLMKEFRMMALEAMRAQRTIINELSETVRNQDKQHVSLRVAMEEMLDRRHEREIETKKLGAGEDRKERAIQMLEPFVRSIAVKLMGPAAAQGENGQSLYGLLSSVFDSFSEEQLQAILMGGNVHLNAMQRQHLAELFVTMKNLEDQKKTNGQANGHANVHTNGAGASAKAQEAREEFPPDPPRTAGGAVTQEERKEQR